MIIATKKDGKVTVGVSVRDTYVDMTEKDLTLIENQPFFKVKGCDDCYVYLEDSTLSMDIFRYNDEIFKDITDGNSIITNVIPKMKKLLNKYLRTIDSKEWDSQMLIVKGDKAYVIGHYFTLCEVDDYACLGFEGYLRGGLTESKDLSPTESILFSVRSLCKMRGANFFPLIICDGSTTNRKIYYK